MTRCVRWTVRWWTQPIGIAPCTCTARCHMKIQPLRKSDSFSLLLDNPSHVTSHSPMYELISTRKLAWYYPRIHISQSPVFTQHRRARSSGVSRWVVIVFHLRANFSCFNKIAWKMYGVCFYSLFFGLYFQTFIFPPPFSFWQFLSSLLCALWPRVVFVLVCDPSLPHAPQGLFSARQLSR